MSLPYNKSSQFRTQVNQANVIKQCYPCGSNIPCNQTIITPIPNDLTLSTLTVSGKVTFLGLVDPTGIEFTPVSANPGNIQANTIWANSTDLDKLYYGNSAVGGGGGGVSAVTAGTNISITGTSTVPIVNLQNPLTATLNLGTQSITGSTSNITLSSGTNQANVNGNLGFTSAVQATPTTKANLFNTGISVETNLNKVIIAPTSITKSVGGAPLTVGTVGSAPLSLIGNGGGIDGVQIQQTSNTGTTLTTNLSNVKYYPDTYVSNNNSNTQAVPAPQTTYQRLTLNNLGVSDVNSWSDYAFVFSGYSLFYRDQNGNIWLCENQTGNIEVWDDTISNLLYSITLTGGSPHPYVNVVYEVAQYAFIGGNFTAINTNIIPQFGLTRVNVSNNYIEEPVYSTAQTINGFNGEVRALTSDNGNDVLYVGGNFTTFEPALTDAKFIASVGVATDNTGNNVFTEVGGGVGGGGGNGIYALYFDTLTNYLQVGGDFTTIDPLGLATNMSYGAMYYPLGGVWSYPFANNNLDALVSVIRPAFGGQLFIAGAFNPPSPLSEPYSFYADSTDVETNYTDSGASLSQPPNYNQAYFNISGFPNAIMRSNTDFIVGYALGSWTSFGDPAGGGNVSGIGFFGNNNWKVIYDGNPNVRTHTTLPHSCAFTGSFKYDNNSFGTYTIVPRNVSQQFIGDAGNSFWSIIGQGVGVFS